MSKIRELLQQNKADVVADNNDHCGSHKGLRRLAQAMNHEEVFDGTLGLTLEELALLKAAAGNMIGVSHGRWTFDPNKDHDNTTRAHLADIHNPRSHHHELLDVILSDHAEGGNFFSSMKKAAQHTFTKKNFNKAKRIGTDVYHMGRDAYKWSQSPQGQKTIEQGMTLAQLAAKSA
jgi:hypothetical protein